MVLEFYYDLLSQPCRAVYLLLKCGKVDFKGYPLSLLKGEHMSPEFLKKNPYHKVPIVIDDGFPLSESVAIMRHIVGKNKLSSQWFATGEMKFQRRVDEFLCWQGSTIRTNCITVFTGMFRDKTSYLAFTKEPMDAEKVNGAKQEVSRCVQHIADYFLKDNNKFIGGSKMSVADILGVCELNQLYPVGELDNLVKSNPKVKAWFERVAKELGAEWKAVNAEVEKFKEMYEKA